MLFLVFSYSFAYKRHMTPSIGNFSLFLLLLFIWKKIPQLMGDMAKVSNHLKEHV